jgi:hypothetical protein
MSSKEFCEFCGAGIGEFRREGEGTCRKCNPTPFSAYLSKDEMLDLLIDLDRLHPLCENCIEAGSCHSPEICHHKDE